MSDRQLRTSTAGGVNKRARKASTTADNDAQQRERKRALDRKAQRASREKTRAHIANLERMVQILSEKNGNAATSELLEEMGRMQAEIERLRKIIESIKGLLGVDIVDMSGAAAPRRTSQSPQSPDPDARRSRSPRRVESKLCEIHSPGPEVTAAEAAAGNHAWKPPVEVPDIQVTDEADWDVPAVDAIEDQDGCMDADNQDNDQDDSEDQELDPISRLRPNVGHTNLDWMDSIDVASVALMGGENNPRHPSLHHTPFWDLPSPIKTKLDPPPLNYSPCKVWQKANEIYAKIFDYNRDKVYEADHTDPGSLVKFVKDGWNTMSLKERSNPILQILREVDQHLFWDLDPVTKIANLYKSMLLLKYYFNAEQHNLEQMPVWQRPVHSQKIRRHPIPIDFFPWPGLRDRLVRYHSYYFSTSSDFSVNYRKHFKFSWPFGFHETYTYNPATDTYKLSPLFQRYHRDMKCWSVEEVFLQKFPEFVGEISVHVAQDMENLPPGITDALDLESDFGLGLQPNPHAHAFELDGHGFANQCVMDLFDEFPTT